MDRRCTSTTLPAGRPAFGASRGMCCLRARRVSPSSLVKGRRTRADGTGRDGTGLGPGQDASEYPRLLNACSVLTAQPVRPRRCRRARLTGGGRLAPGSHLGWRAANPHRPQVRPSPGPTAWRGATAYLAREPEVENGQGFPSQPGRACIAWAYMRPTRMLSSRLACVAWSVAIVDQMHGAVKSAQHTVYPSS